MTALLKFLTRPFTHRDTTDGHDGGDGHESRPMVGLYAQLTPEQRSRARNVDQRINSGLSDLPTVNG